jgi:hypothetical protein
LISIVEGMGQACPAAIGNVMHPLAGYTAPVRGCARLSSFAWYLCPPFTLLTLLMMIAMSLYHMYNKQQVSPPGPVSEIISREIRIYLTYVYAST